jgi:hypothetical protein
MSGPFKILNLRKTVEKRHPESYATAYMRNKKWHKESFNHSTAICGMHNKTLGFKVTDDWKKVTCMKCLKAKVLK